MRVARWTLWIVILVGVFAPMLANDRPIIAKVNGELRFPALGTYVGDRSPAPGHRSWREWWETLPEDGGGFAIMPLIPYGPIENTANANEPPTWEHLLGTDETGRDLLALLVHGATTAVLVGLGVAVLAALLGISLGALAGYSGGLADLVISRIIEVMVCFPALLLVLAVAAFAGHSITGVILVLAALYWVAFARIVRGEFLSLREREFVLAARGLGVSRAQVLFRHMLPVVRGPLWVTGAFLMVNAMVVEATLTFLGLGGGTGSSSWGALLKQGKEHAHEGAWHLWAFPALVLASVVCALHALADDRRGKA